MKGDIKQGIRTRFKNEIRKFGIAWKTTNISPLMQGYCKGFETFVLNNVIYPGLTTDLYDRYSVPLTFRIAMDESVYDIKGVSNDYISDFKSRYTTNSYITNDVDFVEEATRLIKLSGSWTPCTYHGVYVNVERIYFLILSITKNIFQEI